MKLYYAQYSRAVRVAWLLEELELLYEVEKFSIGERTLREPEYKEIHPLGRVPVLIDNEIKIYESGAIVEYILLKYSDGKFKLDITDENFHHYLQWFHYAEGMIMPPLNTIVVETIILTPERRNDINVSRATKLLNQILGVIEQRLEEASYLAGKFSAADIMTGHATIMARHHGIAMEDKPKCLDYIERLMERPALRKACFF